MTTPQRITLMADWWPKACRAQGWKQSDRALRLRVLSEAVKRPLASASELNNVDDVTAVKAHLRMLADDVAKTIETDHPEIGRARVLRVAIGDQLKCLGLYHPNPAGFLAEIIKDKFKHGSRVEPLTLDDLHAVPFTVTNCTTGRKFVIEGQLGQVQLTLARAIQAKRTEAGHSLHEMKIRAGVECTCAKCRRIVMVQKPLAVAETAEVPKVDGVEVPW